MAALLERPEVVGRLSVEDVCIALVDEHVTANLAAMPAAPGYRDASVGELTSSAKAIVDGARPNGFLGFFRKASPLDLLRAIRERTPLGRAFQPMKWDDSEVRALRASAESFAKARGHRNVLVDHALVGLIDHDERFANALRVLGHVPKRVRRALKDLITRTHRSRTLAPLETLLRVSSVRSNFARRRILGTDFIVVDILRSAEVKAALTRVDVVRFDLLFAYVHGVPERAIRSGAHMVEIVFHDDDFTTIETVVEALTGFFGCDREQAAELVLTINREGSAVVATTSADDAASRIGKARGLCRDLLMPLRIVTRPASS